MMPAAVSPGAVRGADAHHSEVRAPLNNRASGGEPSSVKTGAADSARHPRERGEPDRFLVFDLCQKRVPREQG